MAFSDNLRSYKFTSRKQSQRGIMATMLGLIAMISFFVCITDCFKMRGEASPRLGAMGLLSLIFSLVGLILGVLSLGEKDAFQLFTRLGTAICVIALLCWIFVILLGFNVVMI